MTDDGFEHNPNIRHAALAELHAGAYVWALSLTGQEPAAAEDVMQQTYLLILDGRARYDGASSLKTWLFGVVRNVARRHARQRRVQLGLIARLAGSVGDSTLEAGIGNPPTRQDGGPRLRDAVRALPTRQREVLELVFDAEFTLAQAAVVLGISVGSARTHYHRAKTTLRERLEADND